MKRPNKLAKYGVESAEVRLPLEGRSDYRRATLVLIPDTNAYVEQLEISYQSNAIHDSLPGRVEPLPDWRFDVGAPHSGFYGGHIESRFEIGRGGNLIRAAKILDKLAWAQDEYNLRSPCELANVVDALIKLGVSVVIRYYRQGQEVKRCEMECGAGAKACAALRATQATAEATN